MFRGACFFHVFLDVIFSKFEPKMIPKLDTWRGTLRHRSVFFITWFLQARRAPPLRISVVFRLPFECVLFDLGIHFGHCRIPPREHFGIELQEFFWKLFIIRRCYFHVSLTPAGWNPSRHACCFQYSTLKCAPFFCMKTISSGRTPTLQPRHRSG